MRDPVKKSTVVPVNHLKKASIKGNALKSVKGNAGKSDDLQLEGMSLEDYNYFSEVYYMFDQDKSGAIDISELSEAMKSTGIEATEDELQKMMSKVTDGNEIGLNEFLKMVIIIRNQNQKGNGMDLSEVFSVMDIDGNGYITTSDFYKVLENIGEKIPTEQVMEMLNFADDDFDGKVGFEDFCKAMSDVNKS